MIAEEKTENPPLKKPAKKLIFEEQLSRKPNEFPWTQDFIDAMHQGFWTDKEFSFSSDIQDFNVKLNPVKKEIIVRTLSAIGQIEVAVKKFWSKLGDNLPHPSLTDLGYVMANTEVIHNNAYERVSASITIKTADVKTQNYSTSFFVSFAGFKFCKMRSDKFLCAFISSTIGFDFANFTISALSNTSFNC